MKYPNRLLILIVATLLLFAVAPVSLAQTAQITGRVTDSTEAVVPDVAINVVSLQTGSSRRTNTNEQGYYTVPLLSAGAYRMTVQKDGFRTVSRSAIKMDVDQVARIDFVLEVGEVTQEVTVTVTVLQSESAGVGQVVSQKKVVDLPLNGRNFTQLATLTPGALARGSSVGLGGGPLIVINGMRASKTAFMIDGINATNQWVDGVVVQPSPDAIQEFKVQSNALSAEFGQGGGIISIELRSGTNDFHGTLFEFIRNDVLDARNFFNVQPARKRILKQNQFGFATGGPVIKDKTFFFGDYQGGRERRGIIFNSPVASAKMHSGDFSELSTTIFDPATTRPDPADPQRTIRDPFSGNRIPAIRLSRQALFFLDNNFILPPNTPQGNYNRSGNRISDTDQFDLRGDHQLRQGASLFGSYSFQQSTLVNPGLFPTNGGFNDSLRNQRSSVGFIHTFNPRLVNEVRAGHTRSRIFGGAQGVGGTNYTTQSGIGGFAETSASFPGFPGLTITGFGGIDPVLFRPGFRKNNQYNAIDNLTWLRGKQNIKLGGDLRWFMITDENCAFCRSNFTFTGAYTGNGFADFMLGIPFQGFRSFPRNQLGIRRETSQHFYFQDDWKLTPNLTLNLGVRYELIHPPRPARHGSAIFDAKLGKLVVGSDGNGNFDLTSQQVTRFVFPLFADLIVSDTSVGRNDSMRFLDKNDWSPRVGIAWRPAGDFVVRAGYGIFYGLQQVNRTNSTLVASPSFLADERSVFNTTPSPTFDLTNLFRPFSAGSEALSLQGPFAFQVETQMRTPYFQQWNVTLQKAVKGVLSIEGGCSPSKTADSPATIRFRARLRSSPGAVFPSSGRTLWRSRSTTSAVILRATASRMP